MRLIDADKLKTELDAWARSICKSDVYCREDALYIIDSMPTIDAEPVRHGKWMEKRETSKFHVRYFECSECRAASYRYQTRMNYCPNCGAKMDKEG
jgi:hypothetical protein